MKGFIITLAICIFLSISCTVNSFSFKKPHSSNRLSLKVNLKKSVESEKIVVPEDFRVSIGFLAVSIAVSAGLHNLFLGIPIGIIGAFLAFQTTRVRFVFDGEAIEVCRVDKQSETETLKDSGENFAVGGKNRWKYNTFTNWFFIPNKNFPILMYFKETQTSPKGQLHLFPVIMNGRVLYDELMSKVGPVSP